MTSKQKKGLLFLLNIKLNEDLDALEIPKPVIDAFYSEVARTDHYGWFILDKEIFEPLSGTKFKQYKIYCAACQKHSYVDYKPTHKTKFVCEKCRKEIEIRKYGRSKYTVFYKKDYFCYFQNYKGVIVARYYNNCRSYSDKEYVLNPKNELSEYQRIIFRPEGVRSFVKSYWRGEWNEKLYVSEPSTNYRYLQNKTQLREVFSDSYLKNNLWLDSDYSGAFSLYKFSTWPVLEYLSKLEYKTLVKEIIYGRTAEDRTLNLYKSKANEVLGVPHSILQKYEHAALRERDIKAIKQLIDFKRLGQLTLERFKFISSVLTNNSLDPLDVFRSFGIEKVLNYLDKQVALGKQINDNAGCRKGRRVVLKESVWRDFQDYRQECHELGMDITDEGVMFPRDLYSAHSRTTEMVMEKREREKQKKEEEHAAEQLEKYIAAIKSYLDKEFSNEKFLIRVPGSPLEILKEGTALRHCVWSNGYVSRVIKKSSLIFFIRKIKKPDKSFCTLEINPQTASVIQCRSFGNSNAPPEVYEFIKEGLPKILNKKSKLKAAG